jgi:DNA-binding GntR family transcriptional regulator
MTAITPLPPLGPALLRQQALDTLREAIVAGHFNPGDRLVEEDLCRQLGVSRGPVREALRQLEHEGLVISYPYRATEVIGIASAEVREVLLPIRLTLERFAFRAALPLLNDQDFSRLADLVQVMQQGADSGNLAVIVDADVQFHALIMQRSEQHHSLQLWRGILPRVRAFLYRGGRRHASLDEIVEEHRDLLAVLKSGDVDRVLAVLEPHILVDRLLGDAPPSA